MRVLVIPEDSRNDQYILKPLFREFFKSIGKPRAHVRICCDPVLGGIVEALKLERIREIVDQYKGMTDIFILCVDRDLKRGRRSQLDRIEDKFRSDGQAFYAVNAWEEIEIWVLAGLELPKDWLWQKVRAELHVKERYFDPLAERHSVSNGPGGGRKALGAEAAYKIRTIRQKCPEDFDALAHRLEAAVRKQ